MALQDGSETHACVVGACDGWVRVDAAGLVWSRIELRTELE